MDPQLGFILGYLPNGKQYVRNPDGSISSERTMTESHPMLNQGRWTNFPSLLNGQQMGAGSALSRAIMSPTPYPSFDTLEEAESSAQERTKGLSAMIRALEGK